MERGKGTGFDELYNADDFIFGEGPENILVQHIDKINSEFPVLDIGAGQGRNTFYLAKMGFQVDAIDPSISAIRTIFDTATKESLAINAVQSDFENLDKCRDPYSAVLIFGLIPILSWDLIGVLIKRVNEWTQSGSLIFATAFLNDDPAFNTYSKKCRSISKNSFVDQNANFRTFLLPNELLNLFDKFYVIHHWEGMGAFHRHAGGPMERHSIVELVAQRA